MCRFHFSSSSQCAQELIFKCINGISKCIAGWWKEVQYFMCPWLAIAIKPRTENVLKSFILTEIVKQSDTVDWTGKKNWLSPIAELLVSCYLFNKTLNKIMDIIVNTFTKSAAVLIQRSRLSTESHQNANLCCQSPEKVVVIHNTLLATPWFQSKWPVLFYCLAPHLCSWNLGQHIHCAADLLPTWDLPIVP